MIKTVDSDFTLTSKLNGLVKEELKRIEEEKKKKQDEEEAKKLNRDVNDEEEEEKKDLFNLSNEGI